MTSPHPIVNNALVENYKGTLNYIPLSDTQTVVSWTGTWNADTGESVAAVEAIYAGALGLTVAHFAKAKAGEGTSVCVKNSLFAAASDSIQSFPHNARCSGFDGKLHSRTPPVSTPAGLKGACD
jgi:hypothetical protein